MGLQTYDGRNVRLQQAGRSNADVLQLSGAAVCEGGPRSDSREDDPYTVPQVRTTHCVICLNICWDYINQCGLILIYFES